MAGLIATTLLAVSVSVTAPKPTPQAAVWMSSPQADLGHLISDWANTAQVKNVQISEAVRTLQVGAVHVQAASLCDAVQRLIAALKYTVAAPRVATCDANRIEIL